MTAENGHHVSAPGGPVTWCDRVIVVRDERLFAKGHEAVCERLIARVLSADGVRSISLDRPRATLTIRHHCGKHGVAGLLQRLSAAIRDSGPHATASAFSRVLSEPDCTLYRHGPIVSLFEVLRDRRGRLRLRHPSFHEDQARAERVERLIAGVPGVARAMVSAWSSSLLICYDPGVVPMARLVRLAEEAADETGAWERELPGPSRTRYALANSTLGLAALADFAFPLLAPASAVLLIGSNFRVFRAAGIQVRRRQFGLPVLYTAIVAATLASGQFFASALMSWCFQFWHGRLRRELAAERRRLLGESLPLPRLARLIAADGTEVMVPVDRLVPGDRVALDPDEPIPADGRVIEGEGIIDERGARGLAGASRKRPGDTVFAGSSVLAGSFCVEVVLPTDRTRAAAIGRALVSASSPAAGVLSPALRAESFANQTVGPTLATAGIGLLIGDLSAASAILRPDYATGPGVSVPLEALRDAAACAQRGIVARAPDAFARLAGVNLIVIEDSAALRRCALEVVEVKTNLPEAELLRTAASALRHLADERAQALAEACRERRIHMLDLPAIGFGPGVTVVQGKRVVRVRDYAPAPAGSGPLVIEVDQVPVGLISFGRSSRLEASAALERVRSLGPVPIVIVSDRSEGELAPLARELRADAHLGNLSPCEIARFVENCRERGLRTAFVGDCRHHRAAAKSAYASISFIGDADLEGDPASVALLQPRLDLLADLWEAARSHAGRIRSAEQFILVPNLICVAGAFLFGATALSSVVITNLGTFGLYSRSVGKLRALGHSAHGRRQRPRMASARSNS